MTAAARPLISRPGGHTAKYAHRAGAPNTRQLSGENPMVGTLATAGDTAVIEIRDRLAAAGTSWFLTVDSAGRCVQINLCALAALVNTLLAELTAGLRDQVTRWQSEAQQHATEADWLDRAVRIALDVPRVGGSCVEWAAQIRAERDEFATEAEHRETEILEVLAERDHAQARVAELETALARVGESR